MSAHPQRLKIAYISLISPIPNGLSDYSETLLPPLSEWVDLTLYSDVDTPSNRQIADRFVVRPVASLLRHHADHDLRLYQLGNSAQNRNVFDSLRRLPGVVTLHEPYLHTGFRAISRLRYVSELEYELGPAGRQMADRLLSETDRSRLLDLPVLRRTLDLSIGIVVHSQTARRMIEAYEAARPSDWFRPRSAIAVIPQLMPCPPVQDRLECRTALGLPADAVIFGFAGLVDPTKEPELVIDAFARVAAQMPDARLIMAGELPAWYTRLPEMVNDLGLASRVTFLGRLEPIERLHQALAACDVSINLRRPTIGETSGTTLRAMALGRPVIVRDDGWYAELPDAACVKLPQPAGADELAQTMLWLGRDFDLRQDLGDAARRYVRDECDVNAAARRYAEFLQVVWVGYGRMMTGA